MASSVNKFLEHIAIWRSTSPKLVIGIEGYSGAGKTTLVKEGAAKIPATVVHMDDFQVNQASVKMLENSLQNKEDVLIEKYRFDMLRDLIKRFRDGETSATYILNDLDTEQEYSKTFSLDTDLLIIDGIWLSDTAHLPEVFDKTVFLDADTEVADHRRRLRENQDWSANSWEETHPDSPIVQYKLAHEKYIKKYAPEKSADLVLKV